MKRPPDRLPDPQLIRDGKIAIDNIERSDLPEEYLELVEDVLPLPDRKDKTNR